MLRIIAIMTKKGDRILVFLHGITLDVCKGNDLILK